MSEFTTFAECPSCHRTFTVCGLRNHRRFACAEPEHLNKAFWSAQLKRQIEELQEKLRLAESERDALRCSAAKKAGAA